MTSKAILKAINLQMDYQQGNTGEPLSVIKGIDLEIMEGEKLAIVGVSGSGKSTLLNLMGGLDDPSGGSVSLKEKNWSDLDPTQRAAWRNRHVGFVYQFHHLLDEFSALENASLPSLIAGDVSGGGRRPSRSTRARKQRTDHLNNIKSSRQSTDAVFARHFGARAAEQRMSEHPVRCALGGSAATAQLASHTNLQRLTESHTEHN